MNGVTIERTSIRATPGGDVIETIGAGANLVFDATIGNWYRMVSLNGVAQGGYINSRSVKVVTVVTPPPDVPPVVVTEFPHFARVRHFHERYKDEQGRGLSYLAYIRMREGRMVHRGAGGDPSVFQLNQSSKDRAVYLTPELENWMYGLLVESSQNKLPAEQVKKAYRNMLQGAKAFTNRTGWSDGCQSVVLKVNLGAEQQRLQLTICTGATIKVIGDKFKRGGKWVYPIETLNAQDPNTLKRTLKDAWWLMFAATNSTVEPKTEGNVDPFPNLNDFDVVIPMLSNNTDVGYIESGWVEFINTTQPVYPYYRTFVTEEEWKNNRGVK